MLRSLRLLVVALLLLAGVSGCGVGRTQADVARDTRRSFTYDMYELTDDISLLTQTDRPLRTSKWIVD